jgi:hypothetical protein
MITISIQYNLAGFKENLEEFKTEKSTGSYVDSIDFELEIMAFWNEIEEKIKQHFENKGMDESNIEAEVQKTVDKIKYSPAGYSINKFGLGEFLKNAAEPGLGVDALNFLIALDEEKNPLDAHGVTIIVIDNGRGYPKDYLNKDTEKKHGMANMRIVKDPGYVEGDRENKSAMMDRKKTVSNKTEKAGSLGGKGIGLVELAKAVSVYNKEDSKNVLGHMLIGNVDDLNKSPSKSLLSEVEDFKLPTRGAVTILYSPYYSNELIQACEDSFSTRYQDIITSKQLSKAANFDSDSDVEEQDSDVSMSISLAQLSTLPPPPTPVNKQLTNEPMFFPKVNIPITPTTPGGQQAPKFPQTPQTPSLAGNQNFTLPVFPKTPLTKNGTDDKKTADTPRRKF